MTNADVRNGADRKTIDDVRAFWNANPLWTGESSAEPTSRAFFEEHRRVMINDCYAGMLDERIFEGIPESARVVDLGCGIGFWLIEFWQRGFRNIEGADLSTRSLEIAKQRLEFYNIRVPLSERNAEATGFESEVFDHVNCQGVVHHTPSPERAVREICRILKPGGTASISVYYKNFVIRNWRHVRWLPKFLALAGGGLKGRGREDIYAVDDIADIIRRYDGADNPIGYAYNEKEFSRLIGSGFEIDNIFYHFFPARSLPVFMPRSLHRMLDTQLPFMIYGNIRKI